MNDEAKMVAVEKLKEEGNELYKNKKYDDAIMKYREALTLLDTLLLKEKPGDEEWHVLDKKNVPLYLNLAQCYLNIGKYYEAAGAATEVLNRDSSNEKALFRRARSKTCTWDLDEAEKDLNELLQKHPESETLVRKELIVIEQKRKEKDSSDKNIYKAMIKGLKK